MKNYVQPGKNITITAPEALSSGDPVMIGHLFGIVSGDAAEGDDIEIVTEGVFDLPKGAEAIEAGTELHFTEGASMVTTASSAGDLAIGAAVADASSGAATVPVKLYGLAH